MSMIYKLTFPKFYKNFSEGTVTFSIGNIKCRVAGVGYFILHCYDYQDNEILVNGNPYYTSDRFVITHKYNDYIKNFTIDADTLNNSYMFQIEMVLMGVTSENPCWFNQVMFEHGIHENYHKPEEAFDETAVKLNNNNYVVLYKTDGTSLQVMRPNYDNITSKNILRSKYTILAPHLENEPATDTPSKLMMEFINQTEQYLQIKK